MSTTDLIAGGDGVFISRDTGATWSPTGFPTNLSVTALAVSGTDLFAGVAFGGILRSVDSGASWIHADAGFSDYFVKSFLVLGPNLFAGGADRVFRSSNNGVSWTQVFYSQYSNGIPLAVRGSNLFAGTHDGIAFSTDNGTSWTPLGSGLGYVRALAISETTLFAGTIGAGVFRSTDNGVRWVAVNLGLPEHASVYCLSFKGTDLFASIPGTAINDPDPSGGVFLSTNNGASWTRVNQGLPTTGVSFAVIGTKVFAATASGLFLSINNGASWSLVNSGITRPADINAIVVAESKIFAGGSGGVYRTTNSGTNWDPINSGLPTNLTVTSLTVSGLDLLASIVAEGDSGGVFLSTDSGASWTSVNSGLTSTDIRALIASGSDLFCAAGRGGIFLSTNNGAAWVPVNSGIPTDTYVRCLLASGTDLFAGGSAGIFISTNRGMSWIAADSGLPTSFYALSFAVNGENLFVGGAGGLYRSTNNGSSWTVVGSAPLIDFSSLSFSGKNLFVGTTQLSFGIYGSVFLSTDYGTTWTEVNSGLMNTGISSLVVIGTDLFAGTLRGGVWRRPLSQTTSAEIFSTDRPNHVELGQNYPNPFNATTTIQFRLARKSFVSLKVFDALGREIAVLLSEELQAGTYQQKWDAAALASGVYYYRIEAGSFSESKKLVMLR